jgi:hypothetical protein
MARSLTEPSRTPAWAWAASHVGFPPAVAPPCNRWMTVARYRSPAILGRAPGLAAPRSLTAPRGFHSCPAPAQPPMRDGPIPPPRYEPLPPPPGDRYIREPGHWHWNGVQYDWIGGRYVIHEMRYHQLMGALGLVAAGRPMGLAAGALGICRAAFTQTLGLGLDPDCAGSTASFLYRRHAWQPCRP